MFSTLLIVIEKTKTNMKSMRSSRNIRDTRNLLVIEELKIMRTNVKSSLTRMVKREDFSMMWEE